MPSASLLAHRRRAAVLIVAALLAACGKMQTGEAQPGAHPSAFGPASAQPTSAQPQAQPSAHLSTQPALQTPLQTPAQTPGQIFVSRPLTDPRLDLRAGPVDVPLALSIPSLGVGAPVVGVGITPENVMDAPKGPIGDRMWQAAFWYRGSGIPGDSGTATIAGHVDDPLGRPAIFAHIQDLRAGDLIVVHDTRSGFDIRFKVTQTQTYSLQQTADPTVLAQIYGAGPVAGQGPQPAPDGLSHLTLVTCTGYIVNGSFDHHVVVYATRTR